VEYEEPRLECYTKQPNLFGKYFGLFNPDLTGPAIEFRRLHLAEFDGSVSNVQAITDLVQLVQEIGTVC
jgi:hypothetical protein